MSENLFDEIQKKEQKQEEVELFQEKSALKTKERLYRGREDGDGSKGNGPYNPVLPESRKKSVSGMTSSLFRRKKNTATEEDNSALEKEKNAAAKQEEPQVEMKELYTEHYEERKQKDEEIYSFLQQDIEENPKFKELSDVAQNMLFSLKELSEFYTKRIDDIDDAKYEDVGKCVDFFVEYNNDMKEVAKGTQDEIDRKYKEFIEKYEKKYNLKKEDHELLGTYANLYKEAHGNLSAEEIKQGAYSADLSDSDGNFVSGEVVPLQKPTEKDGHLYTEIVQDIQTFTNPLFQHDPVPKDVRQGSAGDCYLIAAINAIVERDPSYVKKMMKDEGDKVTVRFFMPDGSPIYVTVAKSVPCKAYKAQDGHIRKFQLIGAGKDGAPLWVCMIEKAFAAVRTSLEENEIMRSDVRDQVRAGDSLYAGLRSGNIEIALRALLGKNKQKKHVFVESVGSRFINKSISGRKLLESMRKDKKKEMEKELKAEGKKLSKVEWNIKKAETFFGVKISDENDQLYKFFSDDKLFKTMEDFVSRTLRDFFTSKTLKTQNDGTLLNDHLMSVIDKMPKLNIPGYDEEKLKKHYLNYMRNYVLTSGKLSDTINKTGEYTEKEEKLFDKMKEVKDKGRLITAGTVQFRFSRKDGEKVYTEEKVVHGVAGKHAYSIREVVEEERIVAGKKVKQKFVVVVNPWKDFIRQYDKDGNPYMMLNDKKKGLDVGGVYKMEFRDFITTFDSINYY